MADKPTEQPSSAPKRKRGAKKDGAPAGEEKKKVKVKHAKRRAGKRGGRKAVGTKLPVDRTKKPKVQPTTSKHAARVRALKAVKAIQKGTRTRGTKKIRTSVHFNRPRTVRLRRQPKYPRKAVHKQNKMDQYRILKHPLTTESAMKKIEDNNTLVFIVDVKANKKQIRDAIQRMYDIKAEKVNTLIRPTGDKKAYVRLTSDYDALDVANKIGII